MTLVHRIVALEMAGGRAGLGLVMGEADVAPTDWYLTCHFVDDPVMPGTLMYECCQHTLRVLLARLGWSPVGAGEHVHFAPVEGVASRLRCRGQVSPTTRTVRYRIEITEMGYDPEPYALAVASMFADGQHVVEMESMSIRLVGVRREDVETVWREPTPPLHDGRRVLAYAVGKPSEAFGPPYAVFDEGPRKLARLPGPPFLFVDRVERCEAPAWELAPGGWATCSYDVPKDAWYFAANRQPTMPHAVLLEAALQPCGWLAAYVGSALAANEDVCFRNLDGAAEVFREVTPDAGTLTTRARLTKTSRAGGMILQEFDFEVSAGGARVFAGTTGFGFFPHRALAEQVGLRGRVPATVVGPGFELPRLLPRTPDDAAPRVASGLELPGQAFSMIDHVDCLELHGGAKGFGRVVGTKRVDPAEWFFAAHFLGDPVMPGSLGLEALLQLLKVYARERFPRLQRTHRFQALALDARHTWSYRGQVVPTAKSVRVEVDITRVVEGESPQLVGSGSLWVDGKAIYSMTDFALRLVPGGP